MGNLIGGSGSGRGSGSGNGNDNDNDNDNADADLENNGSRNLQRKDQLSRYNVLLGPMLGGSFPTSTAVYNLIKGSTDVVKLFVFGGLTLGVFAAASGLVVATTLGTTPRTVLYVKFASLTAVTTALGLFTAALCTVFDALAYKIGCGCIFGLLIGVLDFVWAFSES